MAMDVKIGGTQMSFVYHSQYLSEIASTILGNFFASFLNDKHHHDLQKSCSADDQIMKD
jgi:hypothetical protein